MLKIIIFCLFSLNALSYNAKIFNFNSPNKINPKDIQEEFFTLENIIIKALNCGIEPRQKIQLLIQSRYEVMQKLGQIFPQLNLIDPFSSTLPFVGFLFPNRWFDFSSSIFLKHAQEESLKTLFADIANMIQHLYYDIQMQIWSLKILYFYINEMTNIISALKMQNENGDKRTTDEDFGFLENSLAGLKHDSAFMNGLSSFLPKVATAMGLDPDFDWSKSLKIENYQFEPVESSKINYFDVWPIAIARSTEISNIDYLIKAAKKNKLSVLFELIDPSYGNILDFGYLPRIKIEKSKIKYLILERDRIRMEISNAIQDSLNYYANSTYTLPILQKAIFFDLEKVRRAIEKHINNKEEAFNVSRVIRFVEGSASQYLRYVNAYFVYLKAKANFDRYKWEGPLYRIVKDHINNKILNNHNDKKSICKRCRH